ncbi:hypothetical protein GIB67_006788 [Kingdonia uniflora]|uniref:Uncharacterized protein n=1 Tax=Kingdonia uniflora TaxID=39325 RepID=A0A7J7KZV5_9MAGN|nr:hypothetical protein GIB67_006788 [Kingdonia uniflora]
MDLGNLNVRATGSHHSSSAVQDELDMLQEENESMLEKLRLAEDKFEEAEARASKKEAALEQRVAALKVTTQSHVKSEEVTSLRFEVETTRDEVTSAIEQLHGVESKVKSLRSMTQRMILTMEEMEEVILKRCWRARYWNLCVQHDIHPDISGQIFLRDMDDLSGEGNIESMLLVEKGMRELASLKVEDAVIFAMAQHR